MGGPTDRKLAKSGRSPARFVAGRKILLSSCGESSTQNHPNVDQFSDGELAVLSLSDTVFGFLEGGQGSLKSATSSCSGEGYPESIVEVDEDEGDDEEEEEDAALLSIEEINKAFWDNHHKLLQETICKTSPVERNIRNAAKEALKEAQKEANYCICRTPTVKGSCRSCLMREIASRLRKAGYDSAVCKSKWRSSPDMPSGEHTYLDVILSSDHKKVSRVIIELTFRAEFEMARGSEEYKQLVARLPEAFVGRAERLNTLVKILCSAAKMCMENNKMHMGPWRKHNYMKAKWFSSSCERIIEPAPAAAAALTQAATVQGLPKQRVKPKASNSMLTVALLDNVTTYNVVVV
ncbi:hypothetical protein Dimus_035217 [Dionaea muscipula]